MKTTFTQAPDQGIEAREHPLHLWRPFWESCILLFLALVAVVCLQAFWVPGCGYNNVYVPDGSTYFNFLQDEYRSPDYFSFLFEATGSPGIYFLFHPFFLVSDKLCIVPNLLLQLGSLVLCCRIFRTFGLRAVWLACLGISANPYALIAATGPNKEIPLTFFFLLFVYGTITRPSVHLTLLSILSTALLRAPFGLMLAGCWAIIIGSRLRIRLAALIFAVPIASLIFFRPFYEDPQIQFKFIAPAPNQGGPMDHFALSTAGLDNPMLGLIMFGFRSVANAFSMGVRFSFFTEYGELALLGVAYWIYGIALGVSMLNILFIVGNQAVVTLRRRFGSGQPESVGANMRSQPLKYMVSVIVFVWMCVSVNLFVHPRYLMPILPLLMGILGGSLSRTRTPKLIGCLVLAVIMYLGAQMALDIPNPPAVTHDDFKPEYLP